MYYRMTRLHWDEERFDDLIEWAATVRERVEKIEGLLFADLVRTGAGQGMVMAGYRREDDFEAASATVLGIIEEMSEFLSDTPHGHAGNVVLSWKGAG